MTTTPTNELEAVDTSDLKEKMARLADEISRREKEEKAHRAKAVELFAIDRGFSSVAEVARVLAGEASANRAAVVYQNPHNAEQTWAGRGRKPKWLHEYLRGGGHLSALPRIITQEEVEPEPDTEIA